MRVEQKRNVKRGKGAPDGRSRPAHLIDTASNTKGMESGGLRGLRFFYGRSGPLALPDEALGQSKALPLAGKFDDVVGYAVDSSFFQHALSC